MRFPDRLTTERLTLRRRSPEDAAAIHAYAIDPTVSKFLNWRPHRSIDETRAYLASVTAWDDPRSRTFLIAPRAGGAPFGGLDIRCDGDDAVTFGYVLARDAWGRGYMTEGLSAVVAWAATQPSLSRIWAYCDVDNPASGRVMEKAGLRFEGIRLAFALHPNVAATKRDCRCYGLALATVTS